MNNTNFGHDCRNNANNAKFEPIIIEVNATTYIKSTTIFSTVKFLIL